jgi:hypothetical protein
MPGAPATCFADRLARTLFPFNTPLTLTATVKAAGAGKTATLLVWHRGRTVFIRSIRMEMETRSPLVMTHRQSAQTKRNAPRGASTIFMRMALILMVATATLVNAAEPDAFLGQWKYDPDKSDVGQATIAFTRLPSGEMRVAYDSQSYTVAMDGRQRPGLYGRTVSWKQVNGRTWEEVERTDGTITGVNTFVISEDGQDLQYTSQQKLPNGKDGEEQRVAFTRTSPEKGLEGTWRVARVTYNAGFETVTLSADGPDGIFIDLGSAQFRARFDGKPYALTGPTVPAGMTMALVRTGPRSFTATQAQNGTHIAVFAYEVSADGGTLTSRAEVGPPGPDTVKSMMAFDRVSSR